MATMAEKCVHLPEGHKFTLYRDEAGDYILSSQEEKGLIVHAKSLQRAVTIMVQAIPEWMTFKKECLRKDLKRGYQANAKKALRLNKEFGTAQFEILSRDSVAWGKSEAGE